MNNRLGIGLLFAGCCLLAVAQPLHAQGKKSHRPIPGLDFDQKDVEKDVEERLRSARDLAEIQALVDWMAKNPDNFSGAEKLQRMRQLLDDQTRNDPKKKAELAELFRGVMTNPKLSNQMKKSFDQIPPAELEKWKKNLQDIPPERLRELEESLRSIPPDELKKLSDQAGPRPSDFNWSEEQLREFQRIAESVAEGKQLGLKDKVELPDLLNKARQNPEVPQDRKELIKRFIPNLDTPEKNDGPSPSRTDVIGDQPAKTTPEPTTPNTGKEAPGSEPSANDDGAAGMLLQLAKWLDKEGDDSWLGAMSGLLKDIATGDGDDKSFALDALEKGARFFNSAPGEPPDQVKGAGSWFKGWNAPSAPKAGASGPSLPSGGPALPGDGMAYALIWVVFLAVLAVVAWKAAAWYRDGGRGGARLLDAWPVLPDAVTTRGDLIRAFEHLALICLGAVAKHCHHLDLADRLGGTDSTANDPRRQAAAHLARLYELARYAPEDEPLAEADMAAARRDLSFLAHQSGASAA